MQLKTNTFADGGNMAIEGHPWINDSTQTAALLLGGDLRISNFDGLIRRDFLLGGLKTNEGSFPGHDTYLHLPLLLSTQNL